MFTQSCQSDFLVIGMVAGEQWGTLIRILATLVTATIVSSWLSRRKIMRLLLFFSHWLSGFVHQLAEMAMATMVSLCLTKSEDTGLIKLLKILELTGSNMLAVTNLAVCINLALIVWSHHTMSRVRSMGSPKHMLFFVAISALAAAAVVPFWDTFVISGTLPWPSSYVERRQDWIIASAFFLEFFVGVCMSVIVLLLLALRLPELLECWHVHRRMRYYFGLTIIAIIVNLAVGVGGAVYILTTRKWHIIIVISWTLRHVHIALDTLVLYGALGRSAIPTTYSDDCTARLPGPGKSSAVCA